MAGHTAMYGKYVPRVRRNTGRRWSFPIQKDSAPRKPETSSSASKMRSMPQSAMATSHTHRNQQARPIG